MNSITVHNMPSSLYAMLKQRARREGKSMNRTIQDLLAEAMGIGTGRSVRGTKDLYEELCGSMPAEECRRLLGAEEEFEKVDPEDWL